jgi:hypothetical protein
MRLCKTNSRSPKYGQKISVRHAHACKKGGLVITRHNEILDELSDLAFKAFILSAVGSRRTNNSFPAEKKTDLEQPNPSVTRSFQNNRGEDRGDLLIRGLWSRGTHRIIDVRVTDAKSKRSI